MKDNWTDRLSDYLDGELNVALVRHESLLGRLSGLPINRPGVSGQVKRSARTLAGALEPVNRAQVHSGVDDRVEAFFFCSLPPAGRARAALAPMAGRQRCWGWLGTSLGCARCAV